MPPQTQLDSLLKVTMTNGDVIYVCPVDNSTNVQWGPNTNITALAEFTTVAAANMDFNGEDNTTKIVAQLGTNNGTAYAAKLCADLMAYGYDDWYLPAAGELNEIYKKLGPFPQGGNGQIFFGIYWSSSEVNDNLAWYQYLIDGSQDYYLKVSNRQYRCVRR